jgi:hypothetical protein
LDRQILSCISIRNILVRWEKKECRDSASAIEKDRLLYQVCFLKKTKTKKKKQCKDVGMNYSKPH